MPIIYLITCALVLSLLTAIPAAALPDTNCTLKTPVREVQNLSQLPTELSKLLPAIADIGAPFNKTDSVDDPDLPFRRLIRAGSHGDDWFVWYEHGGVGYFWQAVVARAPSNGPAIVLADAGTVSDALCTFTDGVLAGRVPPYPAGTWAAGAL
ncbi:hypothetical protein [Mycobacterium asiaticum]|uniref:hypothetical protein n=1 Tax=Mycobacterium asiaticum TaxID=1790 RepID=UPI000A7A2E44|nr:hypothetical protein [Mycobacterium asiaticum]